MGWLCCPDRVWKPIRETSPHNSSGNSATVVSARWASVDPSWRGKSHHVKWWNLFYLTLRVKINLPEVIKFHSKDTFNMNYVQWWNIIFLTLRVDINVSEVIKSHSPNTNSGHPHTCEAMKSHSLTLMADINIHGMMKRHLSGTNSWHKSGDDISFSDSYSRHQPIGNEETPFIDPNNWRPLEWGKKISFSDGYSLHQPIWNEEIPFIRYQQLTSP